MKVTDVGFLLVFWLCAPIIYLREEWWPTLRKEALLERHLIDLYTTAQWVMFFPRLVFGYCVLRVLAYRLYYFMIRQRCAVAGHEYEDAGSYADGDSAREVFVCRHCGEHFSNTYY